MPESMPRFSMVSIAASEVSMVLHSSMKLAIVGLPSEAFNAKGCSAATAKYVTPISVSGRVV